MRSPSDRLTETIMPRNHNNKLTNGLNVGIPVVLRPAGGSQLPRALTSSAWAARHRGASSTPDAVDGW